MYTSYSVLAILYSVQCTLSKLILATPATSSTNYTSTTIQSIIQNTKHSLLLIKTLATNTKYNKIMSLKHYG